MPYSGPTIIGSTPRSNRHVQCTKLAEFYFLKAVRAFPRQMGNFGFVFHVVGLEIAVDVSPQTDLSAIRIPLILGF